MKQNDMRKNESAKTPHEQIKEIEHQMFIQTIKSSKFKSIAALFLVFALLISGTFAYFSDRASTQTIGTAGTVDISLISNINLLDAQGQDILNPGDKRDADITIRNEGNKSVDTRLTITLEGRDKDGNPLNFTGTSTTQSEFDLYLEKDVEQIEGKGWKPKEGTQPVQVKTIEGNEITYQLPIVSLNGNSQHHEEYETIDGVEEYEHSYEFVIIFKGETGNEWQDAKIIIHTKAEAKQHENTEGMWEDVDSDIDSNLPIHKMADGPIFGESQMGLSDIDVIAFTNIPAPTDVDVGSIATADENIKAWFSDAYTYNGVTYDAHTLYISAIDGGIIQAAEDSSNMFSPVTSNGVGWDVKYIDFSNFDISTAKNVSEMFYGCDDLIAIKGSNWTDEAAVTSDTDMFTGCINLAGAVAYDEAKTGFEMANQSGYFVSAFGEFDFSDEVDVETLGHPHVEEEVGEQAYVFCFNVRSAYASDDGSTLYYPYEDYGTVDTGADDAAEGTHLHHEEVVGAYTYVYCTDVESPYASDDGFTFYYPYDFYFDDEDTGSEGEGEDSGSTEEPANVCPGTDGHLHEIYEVGGYTYVYCEGITEPWRDGYVIYYPYEYYY